MCGPRSPSPSRSVMLNRVWAPGQSWACASTTAYPFWCAVRIRSGRTIRVMVRTARSRVEQHQRAMRKRLLDRTPGTHLHSAASPHRDSHAFASMGRSSPGTGCPGEEDRWPHRRIRCRRRTPRLGWLPRPSGAMMRVNGPASRIVTPHRGARSRPERSHPRRRRVVVTASKTAEVQRYWRRFCALHGVPVDQPYDAYAFGDSAEMADRLSALVVHGPKRATAGLLASYEPDEQICEIGLYSIIVEGARPARVRGPDHRRAGQ